MFHHVDLDHRQRRARLEGHRVYGEIERRIFRDQHSDLQRRVIAQRLRRRTSLVTHEHRGRSHTIERKVQLLNHHSSRWATCGDAHITPGRQVHVTTGLQLAFAYSQLTFENVDKPLPDGRSQSSPGFELGRVFGETRSSRWPDVNHRGRFLHAHERCANKGIRRVQQMVGLVRAACVSEMLHQVRHNTPRIVRETEDPLPVRPRRPPPAPTRRDDD